MKLTDLKTGWRVELRNGSTCIVLRDCETEQYGNQDIMFISIGNIGFIIGDGYNADMTCSYDEDWSREYDIMKVYSDYVDGGVFDVDRKLPLIWERKEELKDMTLSEIEDKLGYPVRIVGR